MEKKILELEIPVNRVEGDLDIYVKIEDSKVVDVKSKGTLYRGFENILKDKDVMDSLVITPRVCGICSTSHLLAAAKAIENAFDIIPPAQAVRLRNLSLLAESIQSDMRQTFLMFMSDFASEYYKEYSFYEDALKYYEPFKGQMAKEVLDSTKNILKIIAIIGGQWPHTSHIVPGGVVSIPSDLDLISIKGRIKDFKRWYEKSILTASFEEFEKVTNFEQLEKFCETYKNSQISLFTNIAKETNLFEIGMTNYGYISYGCVNNPLKPNETLIKSGFSNGNSVKEFNQLNITEDNAYAWFDESIPLHPFEAETITDYKKEDAYSWAKAPRYSFTPVQTGPLADEVISKNSLFEDLTSKFNDCVYVRQLARVLRPIRYIKYMEQMISELIENIGETLYEKPKELDNGSGFGLVQAARGALGHWVTIEDSKIQRYQIISPTTWNGSPRDKDGNPGPWEKALLGLQIKDVDHFMEIGHVIRSFDPCLVCTVHNMDSSKTVKIRN